MTEPETPFPLQPVILSGGAGTRLWPLSREAYPKQLLPLQDETLSLLQQTALRVSNSEIFRRPLLIASQEHRFLVAEQLRACNIHPEALLLEPVGRNTAPAIATAALITSATAPERTLAILPADHRIDATEELLRCMKLAAESAAEGTIVTFGIKPETPETGYGYIECGAADTTPEGLFRIASFTEKPDPERAQRYLESGHYFWNSGMFVARADSLLEEFDRFCPKLLDACCASLEASEQDLDFQRLGHEAFASVRAISFDRAIMEHTAKGRVIPCDPGWSDLGSWKSLWQNSPRDDFGNSLSGRVQAQAVSNSYLHSGDTRLLAAIGLDNMLVVSTRDSVLVAPLDESDRVGSLVETMKREGIPEAEEHPVYHRPWGSYETLAESRNFKVKRILVQPGGSLSLQYHHHRSEHWVVVSGLASILCNGERRELRENESLYIPAGMPHRLANEQQAPLLLIEVQCGAYLGEDDIVRLEDVYGRHTPEKPAE